MIARVPPSAALSRAQFVAQYVRPALPCVLPGRFAALPARTRWLVDRDGRPTINAEHFLELIEAQGRDPLVDVELGRMDGASGGAAVPGDAGAVDFKRSQVPLSLFVKMVATAPAGSPYSQLYLAQTPLLQALPALAADAPAPALLPAGEHQYGGSAWIGRAAFTPRHYDVNDNLYVMVGGRKQVSLWAPSGRGGSAPGRNFAATAAAAAAVVDLEPGDGLFIPRRWWHQVRVLPG
ncbi:uncharacterized protein V1510DRAFT_438656 [Dipodascopsis tothii]|uniref:uncharacterized protein n=1 Tax=Dipodascopsis tothii TaxID=44089 RepID=UPI0034CDFD5A